MNFTVRRVVQFKSLDYYINVMSVIMITGTSLWLSRQKRRVKEYIGRRKGSPGKKVSILGPLGTPGTLGPGRREIQTCHNIKLFYALS